MQGSASRIAPFLVMLALPFAIGGTTPGCATSCDDGEEGAPERVTTGTTNAARTSYESDSWDGNYHEFPPQKRYDFVHGLRETPDFVQAFVGFVERPLGDQGGGNISEAVGNEAILEAVNAEYVRLRNDTCETFYVRLVAGVLGDGDDGAAGAASPADGDPATQDGAGGAGEPSAGSAGAGGAAE